MMTTQPTATAADYDLIRDLAYALELAITEELGDLVTILTHAPSTIIDGYDLTTTILFGRNANAAHLLRARREAEELGAEVANASTSAGGLRRLTITVDRGSGPVWARAARRRIVPGPGEVRTVRPADRL